MNRDHSIDIMRGIAMILVVMGHITYCNIWLKAWLYSFHIPLFFFISGTTFSVDKYNWKSFVLKRIKSLLIPYFVFSFTNYIFSFFYDLFFGIDFYTTKKFIGIFLAYRLTDYYNGLWFLITLFFSEILLFHIIKIINKRNNNASTFLALGTVLLVAGIVIINFVKGFLWSLDLVPLASSFICFGYYYKLKKEKLKKYVKIRYFIVFGLINVLLSIINFYFFGFVDLYGATLGNPLFFIIASLSGIITSALFALIVKKCRIIELIGKNTIVIYCLHQTIIIPCVVLLLKRTFVVNNDIFMFVFIFLLTIIFSVALSMFINRFFPMILGKKKFS